MPLLSVALCDETYWVMSHLSHVTKKPYKRDVQKRPTLPFGCETHSLCDETYWVMSHDSPNFQGNQRKFSLSHRHPHRHTHTDDGNRREPNVTCPSTSRHQRSASRCCATHVKRDLHTCQKRPTHRSKETFTQIKRNLNTCQKRRTKETYLPFGCATHSYVRSDPCIHATWLFHVCDVNQKNTWEIPLKRPTKETYKRDLSCLLAVRPIHSCDVTLLYVWQDLENTWEILFRTYQKKHIDMSQETYKRDVQKRRTKETYKRDLRCLLAVRPTHSCVVTLSCVTWLEKYLRNSFSCVLSTCLWRSAAKLRRSPSFICETRFVHMCDMTHSYVWIFYSTAICVTWLIHMCDMAHSYVWHGSFICETWLIHMCDMAHSYVWHDSFICVTRLIHMCDVTHSYVW